MFRNISSLVKESRGKTGWSQSELAKRLGLKNGQLISNVERGECNLPKKSVREFCLVTDTPPGDVILAMTSDFEETLIETIQGEKDEPKNGSGLPVGGE